MKVTLDCNIMQLSRQVSFKSPDRVKIGAVLAKGRRIISVGFNQMQKTHPRMYRKNRHKRLHAELSAVIGVHKTDHRNSTLYLYREDLNGQVAMCKPCSDCQVILEEAGVRKVYYTDDDGKIKQMRV